MHSFPSLIILLHGLADPHMCQNKQQQCLLQYSRLNPPSHHFLPAPSNPPCPRDICMQIQCVFAMQPVLLLINCLLCCLFVRREQPSPPACQRGRGCDSAAFQSPQFQCGWAGAGIPVPLSLGVAQSRTKPHPHGSARALPGDLPCFPTGLRALETHPDGALLVGMH